MKTLPFSLLLCLSGNQIYAQYGGYSNSGSTNYLGAGSSQGVFSDFTYNDGSITSSASATVYFLGSTSNAQHQLLSKLGSATATQIGNAILQNGTGGLFIDNASTGMEIITNFNFNGQNAQVTTLRDASSIANNNIHIDANATISGGNVTNNVNGYLKKDGDAAGFTFPLADGTVYAPATVSALGIGNAITCAYYNSSPAAAGAFEGGPFPNSSVTPAGLQVSAIEYWNILSTGNPTGSLSLTFHGDYSAATLPTLFIVGWRISTNQWEILPSTATGLAPGNTISSTGAIDFSSYSAFTIGFDSPPAITANAATFGCGKQKSMITATGAKGVLPYQFSLDGGIFQDSNIFTGLDTGNYVVSIKDSFGLTSSINVLIKAFQPGEILAGPDTSVAINQPIQLNAIDIDSTGYNQFTWSPPGGLNNPSIENPIATLTKDMIYTVTAVAPNGCEATAQVAIKVFPGPEIYVPSGFTPNGDGKNDILRAIPIGLKTFRYFAVYDRWGQRVFYTTSPSIGWDGKVGRRPESTNTFVWVAEGVDLGGRTILRKGTVVLIR